MTSPDPAIPDDPEPEKSPAERFGDRRETPFSKAKKRKTRPIDPILKPVTLSTQDSRLIDRLPKSFKVLVKAADTWPYPDPDTNGLADPEPYLDDTYTPDTEIEPFSENEPWGKMEDESLGQYQKFLYYRSLGISRSYQAVAKKFRVKSGTISTLASVNNWGARVNAWDDYRERVYTAELLAGVKKMAHRHAEIAREGIEAMAVVFAGISDQLQDEYMREAFLNELAELPVRTQISLAQKTGQVLPNLMNAERLSRGLPTEISANLHQVEHTVSIQSTDDLYSIITGLVGPLTASRTPESDDPGIIEAEAIEDDG